MRAHNKIISTQEESRDAGTTTVISGALLKLEQPVGMYHSLLLLLIWRFYTYGCFPCKRWKGVGFHLCECRRL